MHISDGFSLWLCNKYHFIWIVVERKRIVSFDYASECILQKDFLKMKIPAFCIAHEKAKRENDTQDNYK